MKHSTGQIPRKTVIGKVQPIDITYSEVNNISWTTDGTTTTNKSAELLCIPPNSSFQLDLNINRHPIVLEVAHYCRRSSMGYLPCLMENTAASSLLHLWMWEEQTSFKWISQPQDHQLHISLI